MNDSSSNIDDAVRVLHFGDLHVWKKAFPPGEWWFPKRWLGPVNLLVRRARRFPEHYRKAMIDRVMASDADVVIFTGDFTTLSHPAEFAEAARLFAPIAEKWGERFFAIPGNHDRYTPGTLKKQLLETHLPYAATDGVKRMDVEDWLSIVGVDHSEPLKLRSNGFARPATQDQLRSVCADARAAGREILLAGHFPYATPPEYPETWEHKLIGEDRFATLVGEIAPLAYLHGHKHVRWHVSFKATPDTPCLNCGSAGMASDNPHKQAGYVTFKVNRPQGAHDIRAHTLREDGGWDEGPLDVSKGISSSE